MRGLLALASFFVFVWALIGIVNPSRVKLRHRLQAMGLLALSFGMLVTREGMMSREGAPVGEPDSAVSIGGSAPPAEADVRIAQPRHRW